MPQDFLITVLVCSRTSLVGRLGLSIRCSMVAIAMAPNIRAILVLGGQRDGEKVRILHIINANDPHLLRHANSLACEACHYSSGDEIVRTDDGFRPALFQEPDLIEKRRST